MTVNQLTLASTSRAADAGYLAAADIADIAKLLEADYRLIGGNAVTLLTYVHQVNDMVPGRETADADFGAMPEVVADPQLPSVLSERGYRRVAGNRFVRTTQHDHSTVDLVVDVLTPSLAGRMVNNQPYGDLVVDEIPGLQIALSRDPEVVHLTVALTNRQTLTFTVNLPDVISALILKAYAFKGRMTDRDAIDIWRLAEAAVAAGHDEATWPKSASGRDAGRILRDHFTTTGGPGLRSLGAQPHETARLRLLVMRLVGSSG